MHPAILVGVLPLLLTLPGCQAGPQATPSLAATSEAQSSASSPLVAPATPARSASTSPTPIPSPTASMAAPDTRYYGNFTPYPAPVAADQTTPGSGYRVVFSENLSRHGSRSVSSGSDAKRALALWQRAADDDALTDQGKQFAPAVRKLTAAMTKIGYGELSALGELEQQGLGQREGTRLKDYFTQVDQSDDQVEIINTGVHRTKTSAANFVEGLTKTRPGLRVLSQKTDEELHFGSNDPDYQKFLDDNEDWRAAYEQATADNDLRAASVQGLRRLYSAKFVQEIDDPTKEAKSIWDLYRAQGAMSADVDVNLTPFMDPKTAAAFAFDQDARWFYSQGPGITGTDLSYEAADPLLDDFISAADDRLSGGSTAAVYRFAHDNDVSPFAARLKLPGSTQLKSTKDVYSWADSDFRLAKVAPLAANIEWTLWKNSAGKVLLQVRQNEVPTKLGGSCRLASKTGLFYEWSEAKRCLNAG